jgi:dTDP-glucose 4,6-dehydratase
VARLLVTGGAGFIGSHFIRHWLERHDDSEILNLDLLTYAGNESNLDDVIQHFQGRYRFVAGDIGNRQLVEHLLRTFGPDYIVNFAAESHNSRGVISPEVFYRTNVMGTQVLLQTALDLGVRRFHHISTCEVYGDLPLESSEKFTEQSPMRPRTPYNASKAAADLAVRAYNDTFGLPITISNCSNNYGPFQFPEKVIPHFVVSALLAQKLTVYEHAEYRREWLYVTDHCRAIELILLKGRVGETYNIGSGHEVSVGDIADRILAHFRLDPSSKQIVRDRPGHDRRYLLDSSKIQRDLGWAPSTTFDEGLVRTIEWYQNNESWWRPLLSRLAIAEDKWNIERRVAASDTRDPGEFAVSSR